MQEEPQQKDDKLKIQKKISKIGIVTSGFLDPNITPDKTDEKIYYSTKFFVQLWNDVETYGFTPQTVIANLDKILANNKIPGQKEVVIDHILSNEDFTNLLEKFNILKDLKQSENYADYFNGGKDVAIIRYLVTKERERLSKEVKTTSNNFASIANKWFAGGRTASEDQLFILNRINKFLTMNSTVSRDKVKNKLGAILEEVNPKSKKSFAGRTIDTNARNTALVHIANNSTIREIYTRIEIDIGDKTNKKNVTSSDENIKTNSKK